MSIEVTDQDLTTKAGWEGYLAAECKRTAERGAKGEMRLNECQLALTADVETGKPYPQPMLGIYATIFEGKDDQIESIKEEFAVLTRAISICGKAIASVFVSEAWMSLGVDPKAPRVQPRNDPNRKEALIIVAAHRSFGAVMFTAFISEGRQIGPWERHHDGMTGRFGSFLPPQHIVDDEVTVAASRLYLEMQRSRLQVIWRKDPNATH